MQKHAWQIKHRTPCQNVSVKKNWTCSELCENRNDSWGKTRTKWIFNGRPNREKKNNHCSHLRDFKENRRKMLHTFQKRSPNLQNFHPQKKTGWICEKCKDLPWVLWRFPCHLLVSCPSPHATIRGSIPTANSTQGTVASRLFLWVTGVGLCRLCSSFRHEKTQEKNMPFHPVDDISCISFCSVII